MMPFESEALETFGQFLMAHCRDRALHFYDDLLKFEHFSPALRSRLGKELAPWTSEQQEVVRICIGEAIDHALHDMLFKLHEIADNQREHAEPPSIQVCANGEDVTELSDGLQGELFGEQVWWTRLSSPKKCRWKDTPFSISMTM